MGHNESSVKRFNADTIILDEGLTVASQPNISGALFMSGAKLYIGGLGGGALVTSA